MLLLFCLPGRAQAESRLDILFEQAFPHQDQRALGAEAIGGFVDV